MITPSPVFVRTMLMAAALAVGSPALAQVEQHDLADNALVIAPATQMPEVLPTVPPSVPIRAWQLAAGGADAGPSRVTDRAAWHVGRPIGSVSRTSRLAQPRAARPAKAGLAAYKGAQRVLAGVAMGVLGVVAGTLVGAMAGSAGCGCEDGALYGMMIGAPVGAAAGATLGVLMVR